MAEVDTLLGVLGPGVPRQHAVQLLQDAGGSLEQAVALHFSGAVAPPSPATAALPPALATLRGILGQSLTQTYLSQLLRRCAQMACVAVRDVSRGPVHAACLTIFELSGWRQFRTGGP